MEIEKNLDNLLIKGFMSNPCPMAISDIIDGKYIVVNDALIQTFGYSKEEVIGKTTAELGIFVDRFKRQDAIDIIRRKGCLQDFETLIRCKNNKIISCIFNAKFITVQDKSYLLTVVIDVTDKRKLEQEVIRLEKLNLIGQMSVGISHEVRNPMTTVRGCVQLLMKKPEFIHQREYFELMINELDRANLILTDFLSIMKCDPWNTQNVLKNFTEVVESIKPLLEANALKKRHNLLYFMLDTPKVMINEKEICQLIFNLVLNGFDAMEAGGTLSIKTFQKDKYVVLVVQDQGTGIDNVILRKIGTPFLTTKENGTGLGLAVCYGIAHRHNAKIKVETGSKGTIFSVHFPICQAD